MERYDAVYSVNGAPPKSEVIEAATCKAALERVYAENPAPKGTIRFIRFVFVEGEKE